MSISTNNPAYPATRPLTHSRVSDRPREWGYELDPSGSFHQEHLLLREQAASVSVLEEIGRTQVPRRPPRGKVRNRLLQRVLDRMKADLATVLDLSTLAAESDYSRSHFLPYVSGGDGVFAASILDTATGGTGEDDIARIFRLGHRHRSSLRVFRPCPLL